MTAEKDTPAEVTEVVPVNSAGDVVRESRGALTPMEMLSAAVEGGRDLAVVEKLMELQERWDASQARKAFDEAIAAAKQELPVIEKTKHVYFKAKSGGADTDYWHEGLDDIAKAADPILARHGLNLRFRLDGRPGEPITVTGILSHSAGYREENSLTVPHDSTGNKNAHQAMKSAITLAQRTIKLASLGLAAGRDDDGRAAGGDVPITEEELKDLRAALDDAGADIMQFCRFMEIECLADMPKAKLAGAHKMIAARAKQAKAKAKEAAA